MAATESLTGVPQLSYDELAALTEPGLVTELPGPRTREVNEADAKVTSPSLPRAYPLAPARGARFQFLAIENTNRSTEAPCRLPGSGRASSRDSEALSRPEPGTESSA